MSASENQAAEISEDTKDRKVGQHGLKIRIRLPPRKRLADRKVPDDTESLSDKEVPEQTDNNTRIMTFTDTKVSVEEASSNPAGDRLCKKASINNLSETLSRDILHEEVSFTINSKKLTTITGVQDKQENSCHLVKRLSEEGNKIILCKRLPVENSSNTPMKESFIGASDNSPNKNLAIAGMKGEVEMTNSGTSHCEDISNDIFGYAQLYETSSNTSNKEILEQTDYNTQSTTFTDTKLKVEEASNNSPGESLCNESNSNNLRKILSRDILPEETNFTIGVQDTEEKNCNVKNRLSEEGNKMILSKKLPLENRSNTQITESCIGTTDNRLSKNLPITRVKGELKKFNSGTRPSEDAANDTLGYRHLYETNDTASSKGLPEEATASNPSKNPTSAIQCDDVNDNSVGSSLFEKATNNIATQEMSAEARNNASSRRPATLANNKTSSKKLRTSVVHPTGIRQNTSGLKLFTSVGQTVEQSTSAVNLEAAKEYAEFEEKVRRTVYVDNLSHLATEAVINMALNQFGSVKKVNFLVNYTVPYDIPQSALVEMETEKDAESVVNMLHDFPFMMSGMPRPVRGKHATPEMFNDRPRRPGSKIEFRWVGPRDSDFENVRKFKLMCKRHEVEIKHELEGEELLARQQQDNLDCSYKKLETLDTVILNGCVNRLTSIYNFRLDDAF